ncbi:MAG: DNA polymerase III subunit delta [Spirochaetaceae bacterium]|jgi:DNA polymerase-3 subunit delta|nr:DNA polymerase III subunit delta [Spirochaetaceae bacterium]
MAKGGCYLFLGPEIGEKQDAVDEIRSRLRKSSAPEEISFYAGETAVSAIVSVLQNASLFAESRLIFIKNAEVLKKKEEIEVLADYLEHPQDDTTLILLSDAPSLAKGLETPVPAGNKRIFWELFENRKIEWVNAFFKRSGYRIAGDGVDTILELVENNTDALRRECQRLMLFLGKDKPITGEDVEKLLSHTREESAFTLFSRIAEGDLSKSLTVLRALLMAKEASPAILAGLAWCFRKLRDYAALTESGKANDFEYKKIGMGSAKVRKDYERANRRYNPEACLSLTAEYDMLIRSGGPGLETLLMDIYLYKIHASARASG